MRRTEAKICFSAFVPALAPISCWIQAAEGHWHFPAASKKYKHNLEKSRLMQFSMTSASIDVNQDSAFSRSQGCDYNCVCATPRKYLSDVCTGVLLNSAALGSVQRVLSVQWQAFRRVNQLHWQNIAVSAHNHHIDHHTDPQGNVIANRPYFCLDFFFLRIKYRRESRNSNAFGAAYVHIQPGQFRLWLLRVIKPIQAIFVCAHKLHCRQEGENHNVY